MEQLYRTFQLVQKNKRKTTLIPSFTCNLTLDDCLIIIKLSQEEIENLTAHYFLLKDLDYILLSKVNY